MLRTRTFSNLRLWVLVWFMGSLGVAIASPIVHPQLMQMVCSSSGSVLLLTQTDDGAVQMGASGMDCPLCATVGAPPATHPVIAMVSLPVAHALQPIVAARIAAATAVPPPARGPPSLS